MRTSKLNVSYYILNFPFFIYAKSNKSLDKFNIYFELSRAAYKFSAIS